MTPCPAYTDDRHVFTRAALESLVQAIAQLYEAGRMPLLNMEREIIGHEIRALVTTWIALYPLACGQGDAQERLRARLEQLGHRRVADFDLF